MKFLKSVSWNVAGQLAGALTGVLISVVLAHGLGPSGRGVYALATVASAMVVLAINLGLGQAAIYYMGQGAYALPLIAGNLFSMSWIIGVPVAVLIVLGVPTLAPRLPPELPIALVYAVIMLTPVALGRLYVGHLFAGLQDFKKYNIVLIVEQGARLFLLSAVWLAGGGLAAAVGSYAVSTVLAATCGWYWARREVGRFQLKPQHQVMARLASFGVRSYSTVLLAYLNRRFDMFLVGFFLDSTAVGVYAVAVSLSELVRQIPNALTLVLFSRVAELPAEDATKLTGLVARVTISVVTMAALVILVIAHCFIAGLFGVEFVTASRALQLLMPGIVISSLANIVYSDIAGRGKPEIGLYATIAGFGTMLAADLVLIPSWGIDGAALASTIAYTVYAIIIVGAYLAISREKLRHLLWITADDLSTFRLVVSRFRA
ncbi:MAG: oligosaccharide flippase family protein [Actinomycetota bacterium]